MTEEWRNEEIQELKNGLGSSNPIFQSSSISSAASAKMVAAFRRIKVCRER
jgi:hypothetical protein